MVGVWRGIVASEQTGENEFRVRRTDGAYRWVSSRVVPLKNEDGSIREWVGTLTDMHDQMTAAERLRESEERFRTLTEAMPALVFACDTAGRNDYTNHAYQAYTGLSAESLLGDR